VIYRNYRLKENEKDSESQLVDTPLSLVNDIRIASGYTSQLQRTSPLEECTYSSNLFQNKQSSKMGQVCPTSGVNWNEDAAWKLACEGPTRIRQLLLGAKDDGLGESHGCVVPFDRTTLPTSSENDDNDGLGERDGSEDDVLSLCLEASHAAPRIIHHADCTGKAITESITRAAAEHPLIEFVGDAVVTDLITDENTTAEDGLTIGAQVLNKQTNEVTDYYAVHGVVLASGGLGGIYQHSTNPLGFNALGSSIGLALRLEDRLAGSSRSGLGSNGIVSDLEYVQFHPTSLYLPNEARFLLTEALRGEGAILRDSDGRAFAKDYHPNGELAPRDIVARAVFCESQKSTGEEEHNAYLDITHRDSTWLKDRFPSIHAHLQSRDKPMDFTKERIPVIPAAHYTCGGVTTDMNGCVVGDSNGWYRNLYAAGEAARTGLHGGNRLASTSLLEGLVFGASVGEMVAGVGGSSGVSSDEAALEAREKVMETMHHARHAIEQRLVMGQSSSSSLQTMNGLNGHQSSAAADERTSKEATAILAHLKSLMWDNVGVVRTPSKLALAVSELTAIRDEAEMLWKKNGSAGWEAAALRDAAHAGLAVAESALANRVSGGAHYVVLEDAEDENKGDEMKEPDSDSDEEDGLVAARA
jgi:L-aspartate oxidase